MRSRLRNVLIYRLLYRQKNGVLNMKLSVCLVILLVVMQGAKSEFEAPRQLSTNEVSLSANVDKNSKFAEENFFRF